MLVQTRAGIWPSAKVSGTVAPDPASIDVNGKPALELSGNRIQPCVTFVCFSCQLWCSGKCMFNSVTIHGVRRTMNASERIIASLQEAGEFKLVGTWTLNQAWLRLAIASPTMVLSCRGEGCFQSHTTC